MPLAPDFNFMKVIPPIVIANTVQCLVNDTCNVTFGPVQRRTYRLIRDVPKTLVDMAHIYCISCKTFVG